jgi:Na+/H+-dicarboxylate symporter
MGRMGGPEFLVVIIPILIIYFLPTIVALSRKKSNRTAIFFLNLFLGWTFVGWIVSLVWACTTNNQLQTIVVNNNPQTTPEHRAETIKQPNYDEKLDSLQRLKDLLDSGVLSQVEFEEQKAKVLSS